MIAAAFGVPVIRDAFDFIPVLFIAYVLYAIVSSLVKAARQGQAQQSDGSAPAVAQTMTADQVRAALARRRNALLGKQQQSVERVSPLVQRPVFTAPATPAFGISADQPPSFEEASSLGGMQLLTAPVDASYGSAAPAEVNLTRSIAALRSNPAAIAIIASTIIGPCAARRGLGHEPEDW